MAVPPGRAQCPSAETQASPRHRSTASAWRQSGECISRIENPTRIEQGTACADAPMRCASHRDHRHARLPASTITTLRATAPRDTSVDENTIDCGRAPTRATRNGPEGCGDGLRSEQRDPPFLCPPPSPRHLAIYSMVAGVGSPAPVSLVHEPSPRLSWPSYATRAPRLGASKTPNFPAGLGPAGFSVWAYRG